MAETSHGTLVSRQTVPGGAFTAIGEMGDVVPPGLSRNSFDVTTQNLDIDTFGVGVLRRSEVTLPVNFSWIDGTHDHLTGLVKAIKDKTLDGYMITFPDGFQMIFSGYVTNVGWENPVDGVQRANITLRPSGRMKVGAVIFG